MNMGISGVLTNPSMKGTGRRHFGHRLERAHHPLVDAAQAHVGHVALHHGDGAGAAATGQPIQLADETFHQAAQHDQRAHADADAGGGEECAVAPPPEIAEALVADARQPARHLGGAAALVAQRLHRLQVGCGPRRVDAAQQPQADGGHEALDDDAQVNGTFQKRAHAGRLARQPGEKHAKRDAEHTAHQAQGQRFAHDHAQDAPAAPAYGAQRADLPGAFKHAHHHRAHHAQPADEDGDGGDRPGKALQIARPLFARRIARSFGHRQFVVQIADALHDQVGVGARTQPHLKEAHGAFLLRDALRVFQRNHAARLLHALAGLVNADDAVGLTVDAQGVVDALLERVGAAATDRHLAGTPDWFALDDAKVAHGHAARFVAVDQEIGRLRVGDPTEDAGVYIGDVGNHLHAFGVGLVQVAVDDVQAVGLGDEEVIAEAEGVAVVGHDAIGHRAERDDRRHAHGDAEQGQKAAGGSSPQVVQDHLASLWR
jgi:hypothetical protein